MSYTCKLIEAGKLHPPKWLENNIMFEGMTGSVAYGVSNDSSDMDIVGFVIPPKDVIFPHLRGEIADFSTPGEVFHQFQQHHVEMPEWNKTFDITHYSIVRFFRLAMENNPNMIDVLFLPRRCVLHSTQIYEHVRNNRHLFLHKGSWHKFRGYSYSQLAKIKNKTNSSNTKRAELVENFGFDTKFAYHVVRLLLEVEQIMVSHDLTLDNNVPILKSIREGEWPLEKLVKWAEDKERALEQLYHTSDLRYEPDEVAIKNLLLECIEIHYGSISNSFVKDAGKDVMIRELEAIVNKYK